MWGAIVIGILVLGVIVSLIIVYFATRAPKKPQFSRDDPLYREMVTFLRDVAYYNDTAPDWQLENMVPPKLAAKARQLIDEENRQLRKS